VRDGDPGAFAELFDSYARTVYNHAFRLTADWSIAEDVMAATFMELWRLRDKVETEGGSPRPWLLGIATNIARNHCRSNRRYRATAAAATRAGPAGVEVPDHAAQVAGQVDDRRRIAAALAQLRLPERQVLTLCLWEGLEYADAARALGPPASARNGSSTRRPGERTVQVNASHDGLIKPGAITCSNAVMARAIVDGIKKTPSQAG
jgi:RNA polymerase sigma-70 factor (ECF subfamily)